MILANKNIIITGANRGIGAAIVETCAGLGANIWACARKPDKAFESRLNSLAKKNSVSCFPLYFDMLNEEEMRSAVKIIKGSARSVDGLVNNAGIIAKPASFFMTKADTLRNVMEINFFALTRLTQLIARLMVRSKSGSIVNLTSIAALDGAPGQYEYAASKGAVIGATKELAVELGSHNIRVNAVAPGVIRTEMGLSASDDLLGQTLDRTALHRLGNPVEVAGLVAYLLSDYSSYITGQVYRVDGGGDLNTLPRKFYGI